MPNRTARPSLPLLLVLALATPLSVMRSQQPAPLQPQQSQAELKQLRDSKLARPVFQKATWQVDYEAARAQAKTEDKALLAYFTRSSSPSKESDDFENGPLSDPAFADVAKSFVLFVHCASKVEGEPRPGLMHELGLAVHPTLCYLDAEGKLITVQREQTLGAIAGTGQKVKALIDARAAARKGGAAAEKALFLAELDLDLLVADQIRARLPSIQLSDAEKVDVDRKFVDAEIVALIRQSSALGTAEVGRRIAAMHAAGRLPSERYAFSFWGWVLGHAATTKDGALADQAFTELTRRESPSKDPRRNTQTREHWEKQRAEAKGH